MSKSRQRMTTASHPLTLSAIGHALNDLNSLLESYEAGRSKDLVPLIQFARASLSQILMKIEDGDFVALCNQPSFDLLHGLMRDGRYSDLLKTVPSLPYESNLLATIMAPAHNQAGSQALKKSFVIGVLYFHPFKVPNVITLLDEPNSLYIDLVCGFCRSPKFFQEERESEEYHRFLERFLEWVLDAVERKGTPIFAKKLAEDVASRLSLHVAYSLNGSLLRVQHLKARLLEYLAMDSYGTELDATPLPADLGRERIRIGFLWHDGDARTETLVGLAHLRGLNRSMFEIHSLFFSSSYAQATAHNSLMQEITAHSDVITHLGGKTMRGMVDAVREADLDLLFIVNNITWGWSEYIALAAHRLARVQIVNYCAVTTTGFRNIDVWLSAEDSEQSEGAEEHYTEALVKMPGSVLCFDRLEFPVVIDKTFRRSDAGIPESALLFVSGANFYKLTPALTATWADILARRPDAHLVLYPMNPNWDSRYPLSALRSRLARQLRERGVPTDRIHIVGPWRDHDSVFALLAECDVYLDSFPHAGGISTSDALLLGLPTVTLRGRFQHGIQGANALEALGLDAWVADTREVYIEKALELADDPALRAELHLTMLERLPRSVLLDVEAFGVKLSDTLCDIYRRFIVERSVAPISTAPHTNTI